MVNKKEIALGGYATLEARAARKRAEENILEILDTMKYTETQIVFKEVPDEITLAINISGCPCHCEGCHSSYLAEDIGLPLTWDSLNTLIYINKGITCVSLMGGDANPKAINDLAYHIKLMGLKTCWYSGRQDLAPQIELNNWDYIKLGPYIPNKGGLDSRNTNQRFYKIEDGKKMKDITSCFWK